MCREGCLGGKVWHVVVDRSCNFVHPEFWGSWGFEDRLVMDKWMRMMLFCLGWLWKVSAYKVEEVKSGLALEVHHSIPLIH